MVDNSKSELTGVALYAGVGVLVVWLSMIVWFASHIGDQEVQWSRLVFLLTSVEAVAFGAAGALFGTHIQRQRVTDAKDRAIKAEGEAAKSKDDATKGKALAAAVKAEARVGGTGKGLSRMSNNDTEAQSSTSLELANELLP